MRGADLLVDAFGRVQEEVHAAVDGLSAEQLAFRADERANSIASLVWHLTRVQDDHVADVAGTGQVWIDQDWVGRFGLPFVPYDTGYGHSSRNVAALQVPDGNLLTGYHDAVYEQTVRYVAELTDDDFDRIVDDAWDPPVTLGVRLVSVIGDDMQHAGQAAFLRGVVERRR